MAAGNERRHLRPLRFSDKSGKPMPSSPGRPGLRSPASDWHGYGGGSVTPNPVIARRSST